MAKDKGAKGAEKKSKVADDDFGKPSEAKGGGEGFRVESDENLGKLLLITPLRTKDVAGFEGKEVEVVVADVVVIDEKKPAKSEEHDEVFFFGGWTKGAIRGYIGERRVLGRLAQDKSKGRGKNAAWVLEDATAEDVEAAKAYLATLDPFEKGVKKDADKKSKKK
jgi:hypothetical protein